MYNAVEFVGTLLLGVCLGLIISLVIHMNTSIDYYPTQVIVNSANKNRVVTDEGLRIENKGFNVGDTLVIIKKP